MSGADCRGVLMTATTQTEYGDVADLCLRDDTEWTARGAMCEAWDNLDPAARGDGDRCPKCGEESCCVEQWIPDTPEGYRIWLEAVEHVL